MKEMDNEITNLKEFIHEKFESHEELEALRFKRIDELLSQYARNLKVILKLSSVFTLVLTRSKRVTRH